MKKLAIITCLLLLCSTSGFSQKERFHPAMIELTDGTTSTGIARRLIVPSTKLEFKEGGKKGKLQKIAAEKIKTVTFFYEEPDAPIYESVQAQTVASKKKISTQLLQVVLRKEHITLYGVLYVPVFVSGRTSRKGSPMPVRFCMRPGEDFATFLSLEGGIGFGVQFKKDGAEYFSDYPELAAKIASKEYERDDIAKIIEEYNEWKSLQ